MWSLSSKPAKSLYVFIIIPMCATCPSHLILLHSISLVIFSDEYNFLQLLVSLYSTCQYILVSALFPNNCTLNSYPRARPLEKLQMKKTSATYYIISHCSLFERSITVFTEKLERYRMQQKSRGTFPFP
jgi:hypothetical protein